MPKTLCQCLVAPVTMLLGMLYLEYFFARQCNIWLSPILLFPLLWQEDDANKKNTKCKLL